MKKQPQAQPQTTAVPWTALIVRLLVGGLFVYAGFTKASAPVEEFAAVVQAYYILPPDWALPFAQVLPWVELIFGVYLIAGFWTRASARVLGGLLCMFILAMIMALLRKIPLESCGCFGSEFHMDPRIGVFLDACLFGCAFWLSRRGADAWTLDRWVEMGQP